ncbi:MAG: hypothetical protein HYR75_05790 [Gemmatimonadetes bacterium]|nr:hypothetical protein [Gemmatimonadota bacterium]
MWARCSRRPAPRASPSSSTPTRTASTSIGGTAATRGVTARSSRSAPTRIRSKASTTSRSGSTWPARAASPRTTCSTRATRRTCSPSPARAAPTPHAEDGTDGSEPETARGEGRRREALKGQGGRREAVEGEGERSEAPEVEGRPLRRRTRAPRARDPACTDKRVNMVTPALFARYADAAALAAADLAELEEIIRSTGFYRNKAKSILGMARALVERHGGDVPRTMDELVRLPGVGRKTANVILGNAFGINDGIVVDTHVGRLANRFGLTRETDAVKVEQALLPLFPRQSWTMLSHVMIWHGRRVCDARKPKCGECPLRDICPSALT